MEKDIIGHSDSYYTKSKYFRNGSYVKQQESYTYIGDFVSGTSVSKMQFLEMSVFSHRLRNLTQTLHWNILQQNVTYNIVTGNIHRTANYNMCTIR